METVSVKKTELFDLPSLEIHENITLAIPDIEKRLEFLDHLPPGKERRNKFTDFFQLLGTKLNIELPGFAINPEIPVEGPGVTTGIKGLHIYWRRQPYGHSFFVVMDMHKKRIGIWNTEKTNKYLQIQL